MNVVSRCILICVVTNSIVILRIDLCKRINDFASEGDETISVIVTDRRDETSKPLIIENPLQGELLLQKMRAALDEQKASLHSAKG